jgi:hypothetical protein
MSMYRRACNLSRLLSSIPQLHDPRFRPIGDYTRLQRPGGQVNPSEAAAITTTPMQRSTDTVGE